jgi:TolB-like protein
MSFFTELKRRNVFKVGVAYAIVAWLIMQVAEAFFPALHLPDWTVTFVAVLLIIGFPLALFLTWAYELTPEGVKPTSPEGPARYHTRTTGLQLNYFIIGVLVLVVVFLVVDNYVLVDKPEVVSKEVTQTDIPAQMKGVLPNSIAVLPFDNLNPDAEDSWFSAGLHDELLNQLAKIRDLNIIARTSVLRYANSDKKISEIAEELNVETIMEGTVRYAEGRVRVTTQLVDAATGAHLWSETYTRPFENIFEIETDIASQIAAALEVEFAPEELHRIESATASRSPEALSLEAAWFNSYREHHDEAIRLAQRAIDLDPNNNDIRARAGDVYSMTHDFKQARIKYTEAININPAHLYGHERLAIMEALHGNYARAMEEARIMEQLLGESHSGYWLGVLTYLYGRAQSVSDARRTFNRLEAVAGQYRVGESTWAWAYLGIDDQVRALQSLQRFAEQKEPDDSSFLFGSFITNISGDPVLEQPEFVSVREQLRFPDL